MECFLPFISLTYLILIEVSSSCTLMQSFWWSKWRQLLYLHTIEKSLVYTIQAASAKNFAPLIYSSRVKYMLWKASSKLFILKFIFDKVFVFLQVLYVYFYFGTNLVISRPIYSAIWKCSDIHQICSTATSIRFVCGGLFQGFHSTLTHQLKSE